MFPLGAHFMLSPRDQGVSAGTSVLGRGLRPGVLFEVKLLGVRLFVTALLCGGGLTLPGEALEDPFLRQGVRRSPALGGDVLELLAGDHVDTKLEDLSVTEALAGPGALRGRLGREGREVARELVVFDRSLRLLACAAMPPGDDGIDRLHVATGTETT
jgi:hypothetical protein